MPFQTRKHGLSLVLASIFAVTPVAAVADEPVEDTPVSMQELTRLVDEALPPFIGDDNAALVEKMNNPRLGTPLNKSFDKEAVIRQLFGRRGARRAPDCRSDITQTGDLDRGVCRVTYGNPNGGGDYKELRFSKHMVFGDLSFIDRQADMDLDLSKIPSPTMSNEEAYAGALKFLADTFGLPMEEVPEPPANARNPLPVKDIALAQMGADGKMTSKPVQKLVILRRGLLVGLGDIEGRNLDWLSGPGNAFVAMDDSGIQQVAVRGWQQLQPNPEVLPENAKSRAELIDEIVTDLRGVARSGINAISIGLTIGAMPSENGVGLLLPAVQMSAAPVPDDPTEEEQEAMARTMAATAGVARTYSLVHFKNEQAAGD